MNTQIINRMVRIIMSNFDAHQLPDMEQVCAPKLNDGWTEFVMDLIGNEQRKPDAWEITNSGHTFYEHRVSEAILTEMISRINMGPDTQTIMNWEMQAAGYADYASKLARNCFKYQMHHSIGD